VSAISVCGNAYRIVDIGLKKGYRRGGEGRDTTKQLHLTFAIICPSEIPDPSNKVTFAFPLNDGSTWPDPDLGDRVTLFPSADEYITKIFEPDIPEPSPKAIHCKLVGPLIWKKMSPFPEEEVDEGTLTL
jgi:hypothetical protein